MKLLMSLGAFYPSQIGGPGNTLYWLGKELVHNGVETTAIVSDLGVPADFVARDQWFDLNGIKIKYCNVKSPNNSIKLTWTTIKEVPKNDIVMLSSLFYKPNFFVGLAALARGKRVIWSPRGELLVPRGIVKTTFLRIVKLIFGNRVVFHATSPEEQASVQKFMGHNAKCVIIPNYMELPTKMNAKSEEKYILYVGRIMAIKALDRLIEGIAQSKQFTKQGYKLYLAGKNEGDYYEKILTLIHEKGLEKNILFKGMVEGQEKEYLYAGAKATMLVSHSENFGNVIIESLAQGTPAITSKGTPWQILEQTKTGYWIDNTPEQIGEAIDKLLSIPREEYALMRQRAYELCCNEFNIKTNINKWIICLKAKYF